MPRARATVGRFPRLGLGLLALLGFEALNARAGGECDTAAKSVSVSSNAVSVSLPDQSWSGTGPSTVAELWYGRSLHLEVDLGADATAPRAIFWCGLVESSLVRGVQPLATACAGHFVRVDLPPSGAPDASVPAQGDGGEPGDAGAAPRQTGFIIPTGTVEVLEVSDGLFDKGGRVRLRFNLPATTVSSTDRSTTGTLTLDQLEVDATFDRLPACNPGGCGSCGPRYGGWLPGGG